MAGPKEQDPKANEPEDRGDDHIPTPDEEEDTDKDDKEDKPELSTDDLAAVAAEGHVPYARLKESERQAREEREERIRLETENRLLREQRAEPAAKAAPAVDLKALRKARNDALMEGDSDKAAEIEEQIDTERDRQLTERIVPLAEARAESRVANRELQRTAAAVIKTYPFLDSKSADRNQEAIDETLEWRDFYINKGFASADALQKAVDRVVPAYTDGKSPSGDDDEVSRKRNALALSRGAAAAKNQPAGPLAGKGERSSEKGPIVDVSKLSDEEFAKLPPAEKKRLRGD